MSSLTEDDLELIEEARTRPKRRLKKANHVVHQESKEEQIRQLVDDEEDLYLIQRIFGFTKDFFNRSTICDEHEMFVKRESDVNEREKETKTIQLSDQMERRNSCRVILSQHPKFNALEERAAEIDWILERLVVDFSENKKLEESFKQAMSAVLDKIQNEHLSPEFIWLYQKDYFGSLIDKKKIYDIWNHDSKWTNFYRMKLDLLHRFDQHENFEKIKEYLNGLDEFWMLEKVNSTMSLTIGDDIRSKKRARTKRLYSCQDFVEQEALIRRTLGPFAPVWCRDVESTAIKEISRKAIELMKLILERNVIFFQLVKKFVRENMSLEIKVETQKQADKLWTYMSHEIPFQELSKISVNEISMETYTRLRDLQKNKYLFMQWKVNENKALRFLKSSIEDKVSEMRNETDIWFEALKKVLQESIEEVQKELETSSDDWICEQAIEMLENASLPQFQEAPSRVMAISCHRSLDASWRYVVLNQQGVLLHHGSLNHGDKNCREVFETHGISHIVIGKNGNHTKLLPRTIEGYCATNGKPARQVFHVSTALTPIQVKGDHKAQNLDREAQQALGIGRFFLFPHIALAAKIAEAPHDQYLNEFQNLVDPVYYSRCIRQKMTEILCHRGLDFQIIQKHLAFAPALRLLPGIDSQTLQALWQDIPRLRCRNDLKKLVGRNGYMNCAGFIIFRPKGRGIEDALDRTRIHPEFYWMVEKMVESLEEEPRNSEWLFTIEALDKLADLDLESAAHELAQTHGIRLSSIFDLIIQELDSPFFINWQKPSPKETFSRFRSIMKRCERSGCIINPPRERQQGIIVEHWIPTEINTEAKKYNFLKVDNEKALKILKKGKQKFLIRPQDITMGRASSLILDLLVMPEVVISFPFRVSHKKIVYAQQELDSFESFISNVISPMSRNMERILNHPKFVDIPPASAADILRRLLTLPEEKSTRKSYICLQTSPELQFSYLFNEGSQLFLTPIEVLPDGFVCHNKKIQDLEQLSEINSENNTEKCKFDLLQ